MSESKPPNKGVEPSPLNPFEATPTPAKVEGRIALEILPEMMRGTAVHQALRDDSRRTTILWALAGVLLAGLILGTVYALTR